MLLPKRKLLDMSSNVGHLLTTRVLRAIVITVYTSPPGQVLLSTSVWTSPLILSHKSMDLTLRPLNHCPLSCSGGSCIFAGPAAVYSWITLMRVLRAQCSNLI